MEQLVDLRGQKQSEYYFDALPGGAEILIALDDSIEPGFRWCIAELPAGLVEKAQDKIIREGEGAYFLLRAEQRIKGDIRLVYRKHWLEKGNGESKVRITLGEKDAA
jgi:hypothetical protein